jgi:hypothetical protein
MAEPFAGDMCHRVGMTPAVVRFDACMAPPLIRGLRLECHAESERHRAFHLRDSVFGRAAAPGSTAAQRRHSPALGVDRDFGRDRRVARAARPHRADPAEAFGHRPFAVTRGTSRRAKAY